MKRWFSFMTMVLVCMTSYAQMQLTPYIPEVLSLKAPNAYKLLENKLSNLITSNGLIVSGQGERFVLTCNCVEVSKSVVSASPLQIAYVLDIGMYIGDGETGTKYASESVQTKGVGDTETKAYLNAIKNLRTRSEAISTFIKEGSKRIIDYYEGMKSAIFSSVDACLATGDYQQASYLLSLVPQGCSYFDECQDKMGVVYQQMVDTEGKQLLLKAKGLWAANQDKVTAEQAVNILSNISPLSSSYDDAQVLVHNIYKVVDRINQQSWEEYMRQQEHRRKMEVVEAKAQMQRDEQNARLADTSIKASALVRMQQIRAVRDVAVAYALTRPRISYRVHGWY